MSIDATQCPVIGHAAMAFFKAGLSELESGISGFEYMSTIYFHKMRLTFRKLLLSKVCVTWIKNEKPSLFL